MLSISKLTRFIFLLGLYKSAFGIDVKSESIRKLAYSPAWLKLYQYEDHGGNHFLSDHNSPYFFFSKDGKDNPLNELEEALKAFYNSKATKYGVQKTSANCAFPARKLIIEKHLKIKFPSPKCPDLDRWVKKINGNSASIIFAGAYSNNPASLLGHTVLRIFNNDKDKSRSGMNLLSYSVGFLAQTEPQDNKAQYVIKGIFGGYNGHYNIEPYYMKVGLYNNAESRDLWEKKLNLTAAEVKLLVLHLWEVVHNASFPYLFIDKNCSYRLLTLLEGIRPHLNISQETGWPVLPADTIRILAANKLLENELTFRPSINRRKNWKLESLNKNQYQQFRLALNDVQSIKNINEPEPLDALIDHWTYLNYKQRLMMNAKEKKGMESAFLKRASIAKASPPQLSSRKYQSTYHLYPPFQGHKSSWIGFKTRANSSNNLDLGLTFYLGTHALWQPSKGYDNFAAIEYLGLDLFYNSSSNTLESWTATIARVKSLEAINSFSPKFSWFFDLDLSNQCNLCQSSKENIKFSAGYGISLTILKSRVIFYLLPGIESAITTKKFLASTQLKSGIKFDAMDVRLLLESTKAWWKKEIYSISTAILSTSLSIDSTINLQYSYQNSNKKEQFQFGFIKNF